MNEEERKIRQKEAHQKYKNKKKIKENSNNNKYN
jgi:hypothetical protein